MKKKEVLKWARAIIEVWWQRPDDGLLRWLWNLASFGRETTMGKVGIRIGGKSL